MYVAPVQAPDARRREKDDGYRDRRSPSADGIPIAVAIADAGGHLVLLRAHGRRALPHGAFLDDQGGVRRVEQAAHDGKGRAGPAARHDARASGSRSRPGPSAGRRWKAATRSSSDGECVGGIGVSGGSWEFDDRLAREAVEAIGATADR